jgi:hypothetical protein
MLPDTTFVQPTDPTSVPTVLHSLYGPVHKGLRTQLFSLQTQVAATDPGDTVGCADSNALTREVASHLAHHAHSEDTWIDPLLAEFAPDIAEKLEEEHARFGPVFESILLASNELTSPDTTTRSEALTVLNLDISRFVGGYLAHMDTEERHAMPALESELGLDGVMELHGKIIGSITPEIMAQMQAFMLTAMNHSERLGMLAGVRANAPDAGYLAVVDLARSVLDERDMDQLDGDLARL